MTAWFLLLMICDNSGCISQIAPIAPFYSEAECQQEGVWRKILGATDFECLELPLDRT